MANIKITGYAELNATPDDADLLEIVDDVAGTPTSKKITVANLKAAAAAKGVNADITSLAAVVDTFEIAATNKKIMTVNQTNTGFSSVGGNKTLSSLLDNQVITFTMGGDSALFYICDANGRAGCFFATYDSAIIVEIADPSGFFEITDVDNNHWAVFKSAASSIVTIKNYVNATKSIFILVLGRIASATAPA